MSAPVENSPHRTDNDLPMIGTPPSSSGHCCHLAKWAKPALGVAVCGIVALAAYGVGQRRAASDPAAEPLVMNFPEIDATASATSEKFSISTGLVSEDAEGFFVLDHNSGLLQCQVIYPRIGRFAATFTANVAEALGTSGKGGQYIMVTGQANFPRASNRPAGSCILYVLDTATGNYVCYGVPYDRVAQNAGRPQQGVMRVIYTGTANPLIDRDNLR
ncbi:MAG: hypothetical protein MI861_03885 [Pirellulales bacterium]|nr:hypothetical protein [Pirellulales bacterium]